MHEAVVYQPSNIPLFYQVIMDAVELDKITKFGGYPFSITLRINEKNLSIMIVDKHKVIPFLAYIGLISSHVFVYKLKIRVLGFVQFAFMGRCLFL